jgi:hypothetical protein
VLAAPERITCHWLGDSNAALPVVGDLARGLGARDVALGLMSLQTLDDAVVGPRVQALAGFADAVDAVATLLAREHLPRKGAIGTVLIAGASAAAGLYFSHRLAHA